MPPTQTASQQDVKKAEVLSQCLTEASLSHARAAGLALLFWLPRKMPPPCFAWIIVR